jgi:hypothetical protein
MRRPPAWLFSLALAAGVSGCSDTPSGEPSGDVSDTGGGADVGADLDPDAIIVPDQSEDSALDIAEEPDATEDLAEDTGGDEGADAPDADAAPDVDAPTFEIADCVAEPYALFCVDPNEDLDSDFVRNRDEGNCQIDTDDDGEPDCDDEDSDGDGLSDRVEAGDTDRDTPPPDFDDDGVPDIRDLDSDDDGIPDEVEGADDADDDGEGNSRDTDSDGDGIRDSVEGLDDPDDDGLPNYLDPDSDGDWISDRDEFFADADDDGIPDRYDLDSDEDGVPDSVEAGDENLATPPPDTDNDEAADYQDGDSDGDGLSDTDETGCPDASERLLADSDDDGFNDLAEVAVGSDPCDEESDVFDEVEFFFILPPETVLEDELEFSTDVQQADIHFNIDTTQSLEDEITSLQSIITGALIPAIEEIVADPAFGVSSFRDFPVAPFGLAIDYPYRLEQRITTRASDVQIGANNLVAAGGADLPESGFEALYQIATGSGGPDWGSMMTRLPPWDDEVGYVEGEADGTIGGVGFREGSFPVIIHITDALSHSRTDYTSSGQVRNPHSEGQALNALDAIGARVVSLITVNSPPRDQLREFAVNSGTVVPPCAFDDACGAGQCCTGLDGSAEAPDDGLCPLVFSVGLDGAFDEGLVADALQFLLRGSRFEVTTRVLADPVALSEDGIDTSCFIRSVLPAGSIPPTSCSTIPSPVDLFPPAGEDDSFINVSPGTTVIFDVTAENDGCVEQTDQPQTFEATIEVIGDRITLLDSLRVTIIIPPIVFLGEK